MPKSFTPEEVEVAKLRLAFLKENVSFAKFYEKLAKNPYKLCPELRKPGENFDEYRHKIHILEIEGTSFFGGYAQQFGINDKFLRELQLLPALKEFPPNATEDFPSVSTEDVLILLNPKTNFDEVSCPELIEMLPLMFRTAGVIEYGLAHGLVSNSDGELTYRRYVPSIDINLKPYERLLKIDLRKKKEQIITEFKNFIDIEILMQVEGSRLELETALEWSPDITRNRKEGWDQLKVWKMRKKVIGFSKIALKTKTSEDTAKQRFYRAFELITGKKYNKYIWKKLIIEKLIKDKNYKRLLDFEETKQQNKLLKRDDDEKGDKIEKCPQDPSWHDDPHARLLFEDIKKKYCENCTDLKCRDSVYGGDLEVFQNCPQVIDFLYE